jgi:hypothetical protein
MRNDNIASHILPTSATMVGVCMTVLSIAKLVEGQTEHPYIIDELMAFNSLMFLLSAGLSYLSIRNQRLHVKLERVADHLFMGGLTLMTISAFLFTYALY